LRMRFGYHAWQSAGISPPDRRFAII